MWLKKLGENVSEFLKDEPDSDDEEEEDVLGLNELFDKAKDYGSHMLESANDVVLRGSIGEFLAPKTAMPSPKRHMVVGIMGSGSSSYPELALPLARWVAASGFSLLTGGGQGVMKAACRSFTSVPSRTGVCIGVIPCAEDAMSPMEGYPNEFVELPVYTHMPLVPGESDRSRNHINVLTSDVIIALPGSLGTCSEVLLAQKYGKPVILYLGDDPNVEIEGLPLGDPTPIAQTLEDVQRFVLRNVPTNIPSMTTVDQQPRVDDNDNNCKTQRDGQDEREEYQRELERVFNGCDASCQTDFDTPIIQRNYSEEFPVDEYELVNYPK